MRSCGVRPCAEIGLASTTFLCTAASTDLSAQSLLLSVVLLFVKRSLQVHVNVGLARAARDHITFSYSELISKKNQLQIQLVIPC